MSDITIVLFPTIADERKSKNKHGGCDVIGANASTIMKVWMS
jgi:hypothetical protein